MAITGLVLIQTRIMRGLNGKQNECRAIAHYSEVFTAFTPGPFEPCSPPNRGIEDTVKRNRINLTLVLTIA